MRKVIALTTTTAIFFGFWSNSSAQGAANQKQVQHKPPSDTTSTCAQCPSLHSGFFGGLKGGYASAKGNLKLDGQATPLGPVSFSERTDLGIDGGEIGLFLGYDHYFVHNWVLGIEGGAQWTSLSGNVSAFSSSPALISASNLKIRLNSEWSFDVAVRLGHKVYDRSLWYVKAGAQFTRFKFTTQDLQTNTLINLTNTGAPFARSNKYYAGLLTGLGVEVPISCNLSLGAEYNFTLYQRVSDSKVATNGSGDFIKASIRPHESRILARIILKI